MISLKITLIRRRSTKGFLKRESLHLFQTGALGFLWPLGALGIEKGVPIFSAVEYTLAKLTVCIGFKKGCIAGDDTLTNDPLTVGIEIQKEHPRDTGHRDQ